MRNDETQAAGGTVERRIRSICYTVGYDVTEDLGFSGACDYRYQEAGGGLWSSRVEQQTCYRIGGL